MGFFRVVLVSLFVVVFFYLSHQLTRFADLSLGMVSIVNLGLISILGIVLAQPLYFWSDRRLEHRPWHDSFSRVAHLCMAYINFLISFVILRDVAAFALEYLAPAYSTEFAFGKEALGIMLTLPLFLILLGTLVVRVGPRVTHVALGFKNLPKGLENLRILHITDLHISSSLPVHFVEKLVQRVNKLKPDLVVYTGDILDSQAIRHLAEFDSLKKMESRLGHYYVPGNHEYYWDVDQGLAAFRSVDFNVLINETANLTINNSLLQISGIPDPAARMFRKEEPDFEKVAAQLKPEGFKLLLSHQPSLAKQACKKGFDLQLSGHTHGGQFFPWNLLIGFFERYSKGLYRIQGMQLYVNQGTGYWGPSLRLGTYCELTVITLTSNVSILRRGRSAKR
ncbi:metallophosphoesterase [Bdellovibrio svalbardensis]|uniref:Metallophosphoesterase n=1 Tax=Bdellovibrio svalbardensis TaxID=2972972 RepID=A0ABT6DJK6_9BACT|nr:metallophosphoesterase [Bdellovibrio svalbardensis]MDG0817045.1 metallophosphoesterase [Bdellovibrio svalbardensis]